MPTTSNKKRPAGAAKNKPPARKTKEPLDGGMKKEIVIVLMLAVALFLFLCNFSVMGALGDHISRVLFGLFGLLAYVAPLLLFLCLTFGLLNRASGAAVRKIISGICLFLAIGIVCELPVANLDGETTYDIVKIYTRCADFKNGGGVIMGSLAYLCHQMLDTVGTVLITLVVAIISLLILTNRPLLSKAKEGGEKLIDHTIKEGSERHKDWRSRREEMMAERDREREEAENEKILRRDKKVSGVMQNTKLTETVDATPGPREDMHEINLTDFESQMEPAVVAEDIPLPVYDAADEMVEVKAGRKRTEQRSTKNKAASRPKSTRRDEYQFPDCELLLEGKAGRVDRSRELNETAARLVNTLQTFGIKVTITQISQGPAVTRYEMQPEQGVKVSKIVNLQDDIKMNLAAFDIRIEAPIPGKPAIGIEVPNSEYVTVSLRDLIDSKEFDLFPSDTIFAVGKDIGGQNVFGDISKMPHMLIAGATGSGKSVCINTLVMSLLYKAHPDDVCMMMIDPKVVELNVYNGIPHLLVPVVTDAKEAAGTLKMGVGIMTERYKMFAALNVRDLKGYNDLVSGKRGADLPEHSGHLPRIIIIVDELADLMMVASKEVEGFICRLAQLGRAAGIHLIVATQRPSVDVITGLIKANMPSRIAFNVASGIDSRTILDMIGAEKLLGRGDMLYYPQGSTRPSRIQGAFVTDEEVGRVVAFLKEQAWVNKYNSGIAEQIKENAKQFEEKSKRGKEPDEGPQDVNPKFADYDPLFVDVGWFIIETDKASIGNCQRKFRIGFNRSARIMDELCEAGVVGPEEGTKTRRILMNAEDFAQFVDN